MSQKNVVEDDLAWLMPQTEHAPFSRPFPKIWKLKLQRNCTHTTESEGC